ncbi:MAG: hypothetical protein JO115_09970 [Pseudonocardiales bacterium]|nr:hypothetical protein [Pseudonocardiales bacterium]
MENGESDHNNLGRSIRPEATAMAHYHASVPGRAGWRRTGIALADHDHPLAAGHPLAWQPTWVRCSRDQYLHLVDSAGVAAGECVAVCGRLIWPEVHTFSSESRGLCAGCLAGLAGTAERVLRVGGEIR